MKATHVNAYKDELANAIKDALSAIGEIEAKVNKLVEKYETDLIPQVPVVPEPVVTTPSVSSGATGATGAPLNGLTGATGAAAKGATGPVLTI